LTVIIVIVKLQLVQLECNFIITSGQDE
jgi:hypothetical protein